MAFTHYILTRFNVGLYSDNPYNVSDPNEWMEHRLELFKACKESVLTQDAEFQWVLAVDEATPQKYLDEIFTDDRMIMYHGNLKEVFNTIKVDTDWVITTRMDNDDTYYEGALQAIQDVFYNRRMVIDIDYHQEYQGVKSASKRTRANSPFLSLAEPTKDEIKTCYDKMHSNMPDHYPNFKIKYPYANMVIHDRNQCNKLV